MIKLISILFVALFFYQSWGRVCYSTGNGNWDNATIWSCTGGPIAGDTIYILAGHIVTIASTISYIGDPMYIIIEGTLHFNNGRKLRLPCNSEVRTVSNGQITANGYTGNSENIEICNTIVWAANSGPVNAPTVLGTSFSPLPIQLLNFNLELKNNTVKLSWITLTENNNDYFEVQRSKDANKWEVLDIIKGQGTSNWVVEYLYFDLNPYYGHNYYRLKQVDHNGNYTYTEIIHIKINYSTINVVKIYSITGQELNKEDIYCSPCIILFDNNTLLKK